jgi:hypothetical protein
MLPTDLDRWQSSDTVFRCYDPHTRAYSVLLEPKSREIERLLTGSEDAHKDVRCLACHATPTLANRPDDPMLAQGIGCEACHGTAEKWIADHAGWSPGPGHDQRLAAAGMTHLADPLVRATTCAGCHIGAPSAGDVPVRDMNHDLIAAGHPRLNFDYGTYLRALPPHWAEKDRTVSPPKLRPASDEFTHWLTGRAAMAIAVHQLRVDRAKRGPWPELAEFDCYACHHSLKGETKKPLGDRPGALVWNESPIRWLFAPEEYRGLQAAMSRPLDAEGIGAASERSAAQIERTVRKLPAELRSPATIAQMLSLNEPRRWDEACHMYYALLVLDRVADPEREHLDPRPLWKIRDRLYLPRDAAGAKYNSPLDFDAEGLGFARLFGQREGILRKRFK